MVVYEQEFGGKTRKNYSLTKQGGKLLEKKMVEWKHQDFVVREMTVNVSHFDYRG
jgi:DNA-binding PadR family transcriptional regulator